MSLKWFALVSSKELDLSATHFKPEDVASILIFASLHGICQRTPSRQKAEERDREGQREKKKEIERERERENERAGGVRGGGLAGG